MSSRTMCVSLLSGGLDSCVASSWAKRRGYTLRLLSANYGQVMQRELEHAKKIAESLGPIEHRVLDMSGFRELSWSSRTNESLIEYDRPFDPSQVVAAPFEISAAYPPGRDPTFIFMAAAWVESLMLERIEDVSEGKIVIGTNRNDAAMFPDCRAEAYSVINHLLGITTKVALQYKKPITVETPLIGLSKADVIRLGRELGSPLELSWSCYEGSEKACGRCDPCKLRLWAFREVGETDPASYDASLFEANS